MRHQSHMFLICQFCEHGTNNYKKRVYQFRFDCLIIPYQLKYKPLKKNCFFRVSSQMQGRSIEIIKYISGGGGL